jgi:DNA polymerase III epsilon subunit-like protein
MPGPNRKLAGRKGDLAVHPRRKRFGDVRLWVNRCFDAQTRRAEFVRRWLLDPTEGDEANLLLCCRYHEHDHFPDELPGKVWASRLSAAAGFWFHPRREQCRTCCPLGPAGQARYLVYDTETTGTSYSDVVIQLGFVLFDGTGREIRRYERVWRTEQPSNPWAQRVHGIPLEEVRGSDTSPGDGLTVFQEVLDEVGRNGGVVVAHNAAFDHRMVQQTADREGFDLRWGPTEFCTARALKTRSVTERGPSCKNGEVYRYLGGPALGRMHRALTDALATAYIFFRAQDLGWCAL